MVHDFPRTSIFSGFRNAMIMLAQSLVQIGPATNVEPSSGPAIEHVDVKHRMARPERFELPTFWFVARRSIQLSYGRATCIDSKSFTPVNDTIFGALTF